MMYKVTFSKNETSEAWEVMYLNDIVLNIVKEKVKNGWFVKIEKI